MEEKQKNREPESRKLENIKRKGIKPENIGPEDTGRNYLEERFCRKVTKELETFKEEVLQADKEEIYALAYRIDCMTRIYEMLVEGNTKLREEELEQCLQEEGLLWTLYQRWLKAPAPGEEELEHSLWSGIRELWKDAEPGGRDKQKENRQGMPGNRGKERIYEEADSHRKPAA